MWHRYNYTDGKNKLWITKSGIKLQARTFRVKIFQEQSSTQFWRFAISFVLVSSNGYTCWTFQWNQHLPFLYVSSGVFGLISIAEDSGVSELICLFITNCLLSVVTWCSFMGHWDVARSCEPGSRCWLNRVYTGRFSSTCGHVIEVQEWCTAGCVPDVHMWHHRDGVSTPGSRTYIVAFILFMPHLEASPGYIQSALELCETVCRSTTFARTDPVCRSNTSHAAATASSSAVRLVSTPHEMENSHEFSHQNWFK